MSMEEVITYVECVVMIGVLLYCGAVVLDRLTAANMINATGRFNGTTSQIAGMWTSSAGMISTVIIIGAAAIIIKMVMNFRSGSRSEE